MVSMEQPAPPRPVETQAAMGALALLSLQEIHDVLAWCRDPRDPDPARFGAGAVIVFLLSLGILIGLSFRSRRAWWLGVVVMGGLGVLCLVVSWPPMRWAVPGLEGPVSRGGVSAIDGWTEPRWARDWRAFWVISKIVLMLTVSAALLAGKLRERLRR